MKMISVGSTNFLIKIKNLNDVEFSIVRMQNDRIFFTLIYKKGLYSGIEVVGLDKCILRGFSLSFRPDIFLTIKLI